VSRAQLASLSIASSVASNSHLSFIRPHSQHVRSFAQSSSRLARRCWSRSDRHKGTQSPFDRRRSQIASREGRGRESTSTSLVVPPRNPALKCILTRLVTMCSPPERQRPPQVALHLSSRDRRLPSSPRLLHLVLAQHLPVCRSASWKA
jgi:hypothetical protein